jgi:hypothetical protein
MRLILFILLVLNSQAFGQDGQITVISDDLKFWVENNQILSIELIDPHGELWTTDDYQYNQRKFTKYTFNKNGDLKDFRKGYVNEIISHAVNGNFEEQNFKKQDQLFFKVMSEKFDSDSNQLKTYRISMDDLLYEYTREYYESDILVERKSINDIVFYEKIVTTVLILDPSLQLKSQLEFVYDPESFCQVENLLCRSQLQEFFYFDSLTSNGSILKCWNIRHTNYSSGDVHTTQFIQNNVVKDYLSQVVSTYQKNYSLGLEPDEIVRYKVAQYILDNYQLSDRKIINNPPIFLVEPILQNEKFIKITPYDEIKDENLKQRTIVWLPDVFEMQVDTINGLILKTFREFDLEDNVFKKISKYTISDKNGNIVFEETYDSESKTWTRKEFKPEDNKTTGYSLFELHKSKNNFSVHKRDKKYRLVETVVLNNKFDQLFQKLIEEGYEVKITYAE